jgi:hypothetical protein
MLNTALAIAVMIVGVRLVEFSRTVAKEVETWRLQRKQKILAAEAK